MDETTEKMQFAVLIDADNISSKYAATMFDELEKYGISTYRRIYGNWSKSNGWTERLLLEYSIMPVQQFSYTTGKNATDMAMVIDAMDILYKDKVQGFCLVTSDSDFTRLAMRLREENKFVIGMGESKTPVALTRACNKFVHLNLVAEQNKDTSESISDSSDAQYVTTLSEVKQVILSLLNENGDKPVELGMMGNRLNEKFSDFDVRNYGYSKLGVLISEELPDLEIKKINNQNYIMKHTSITRTELEHEIMQMIEKNGGVIENLSTLNEDLRKKYKHFDLKEFGYSRISSFLRSMKGLSVHQNRVSTTEYEKQERKQRELLMASESTVTSENPAKAEPKNIAEQQSITEQQSSAEQQHIQESQNGKEFQNSHGSEQQENAATESTEDKPVKKMEKKPVRRIPARRKEKPENTVKQETVKETADLPQEKKVIEKKPAAKVAKQPEETVEKIEKTEKETAGEKSKGLGKGVKPEKTIEKSAEKIEQELSVELAENPAEGKNIEETKKEAEPKKAEEAKKATEAKKPADVKKSAEQKKPARPRTRTTANKSEDKTPETSKLSQSKKTTVKRRSTRKTFDIEE